MRKPSQKKPSQQKPSQRRGCSPFGRLFKPKQKKKAQIFEVKKMDWVKFFTEEERRLKAESAAEAGGYNFRDPYSRAIFFESLGEIGPLEQKKAVRIAAERSSEARNSQITQLKKFASATSFQFGCRKGSIVSPLGNVVEIGPTVIQRGSQEKIIAQVQAILGQRLPKGFKYGCILAQLLPTVELKKGSHGAFEWDIFEKNEAGIEAAHDFILSSGKTPIVFFQ